MADLKSICEIVWRRLNPNPTPQTVPTLDEMVESGKLEYSYWLWRNSREQKALEGEWEIPSSILRQATLEVVDNVADVSDLNIFRSLENDTWLSIMSGDDCSYIKQTVNTSRIFDEDEIGNKKAYYVVGNKIVFPRGAHSKKIPIIYASNGEDLDDEINVDDAMGGFIRRQLELIYGNKVMADATVNSNPNT